MQKRTKVRATRLGTLSNQPLPLMTDKFEIDTIKAKQNIRTARLNMGWTISEFSSAVGLTGKMLEDLEALRDYGCFINWEVLCRISDVTGVSLDELRSGKAS